MLRIDRKVAKSLLKLTRKYSDEIFYSSEKTGFILVHIAADPETSVPFPIPKDEISASLKRLEKANLITVNTRVWGDDLYFSITPELLHYKAFWFDRFSHRFIGGFVTGVIVGISANLLTPFFSAGIARLVELLQSLL